MLIADSQIDAKLNEDQRGKIHKSLTYPSLSLLIEVTVLGQDPLIPPQLLQSEIVAVCPLIFALFPNEG